MNILIISTEYAKKFSIGSLRPVGMSKYFISQGHNVTVLLPGEYSKEFDKKIFCDLARSNIRFINVGAPSFMFNEEEAFIAKDISRIRRIIFNRLPKRILRFIYDTKTDIINKIWVEKTKRYIDKSMDVTEFDIVFSTAPSERAIAVGYYIKNKYNIKWVCDFRDIMVQGFYTFLTNKIHKYRQKKYVAAADMITAVSKASAEYLAGEKYKNKVKFIPNGYDGEISEKNTKATGKLKFAYTGILYNGERVLSILFDALGILIKNEELSINDIEFNYAGGEGEIIKEQAKKYGFSEIINDLGIIPWEESKKLQRNSDFLVVASWNTNTNRGVIPAKIYEYMVAAKPIISVVTGDVPSAELSHMVTDMNLGIACEYIDYENSVNKLVEYLRLQLKSITEYGELIYNPDYKKMEFYKRENTAEKMLELFNELLTEERV